MSTTSQLLTAGYCRMNFIPYIVQGIVNIIAKYYEIIEKFSVFDKEFLILYDNGESIQYSEEFEKCRWYNQKTAYGNICIPFTDWDNEKTIKWRIEFSMLKLCTYPFFIGICNHSSFTYCGPHKYIEPSQKKTGYLGFAFCLYKKIWCHRFVSINMRHDTRGKYEQIQSELGSMNENDYDWIGVDNELVFGEVVFNVKIKKNWIYIDIKIYKHPYTYIKGSYSYHDCKWNRFYTPLTEFNDWYLAISLPYGATAQILSLDIDNNLMFHIRKNMNKDSISDYNII